MTDDKPVFKPIPRRKVLTPAEAQAKWEEKQRKKFPSFRYVEPKPRC